VIPREAVKENAGIKLKPLEISNTLKAMRIMKKSAHRTVLNKLIKL
jgi:hypothetical protein